ncbi:hypothetical protein [Pseudorhodoferax sp. Leaf265]|uniref:hypothetical protein n=1 Tax=Pseudorhodoferax sp. Leaf265 TaxID=1736315 RepID=UPI0006FE703A|nr:hypothetical protein [Pseudorhodoferax sp. Leaf265]KQP21389.1 hypothetical protein ASF45_04235 [Pseudorhodoferax sp. Leaf265]
MKPREPGAAAIELSLVRLKDDTHRVIDFTENAEVGGIDPSPDPLEPTFISAPPDAEQPACTSPPPADGLFLDRLSVGAELGRGHAGEAELRLRVVMTL